MGYFGSSALSAIKFGSSAVSKVYRGASLLWELATGGGDPDFANVTLLLHGNGTDGGTVFTDSSSNGYASTIWQGTPTTSTTQVKYGSAALSFPGSSSFGPSNSDSSGVAAFGSGDFTIECWIYPTTTTSQWGVFKRGGSATIGPEVFCNVSSNAGSGSLNFWYSTDGSNSTFVSGSCSDLANTWTHIAIVRSGSTIAGYVGGAQVFSQAITGSLADQTGYRFLIGEGNTSSATGYIDDFRVTKGVARYTGAFTPPAAEFPDSAGSVFTGFSTGFESGDTLFTGGNVGAVSTTQVYDGAQSWLISNSEVQAGDRSNLLTGLATDKRYDCYSIWMYAQDTTLCDGSGSWRTAIVGTTTDYANTGWVIYSRANNFAVGGEGQFHEFAGTPGTISSNTWHHYYVQVDYLSTSPNKSLVSPQFSIWVDGVQYVNAQASGNSTHNNGFGGFSAGYDAWYSTYGLSGGGFNRYYDKMIVNASDTLPVAPGNTTPAAIEAALLAF